MSSAPNFSILLKALTLNLCRGNGILKLLVTM